MKNWIASIVVALAGLGSGPAAGEPNIVLIMADDMGYECVTANHVPFIANWPGTIRAGKVSRDLVAFSDFLPPVCDPLKVKPLDTGRLGNAQRKTLAMLQNVLDEKEGTRTRLDLKKYKTKK